MGKKIIMKNNQILKISDRISPSTKPTVEKDNGFYSRMFIQDFTFNFLFESINSDKFYTIEPEKSSLKEWINESNIKSIDDFISVAIYEMLINRKAYAERVLVNDNSIYTNKGIVFTIIYNIFSFPLFKRRIFISKGLDNRIIVFPIKKDKLIELNIKDINENRKTYIRDIKKIDKISSSILSLDAINKKYDYSLRSDLLQYSKAKYTRKNYWNSRDYDNKFINDNYALYKLEKYTLLRKKFLDYILAKINESISKIDQIYKINGKISYINIYEDIDGVYEKYYNKKITIEDAMNKIVKK